MTVRGIKDKQDEVIISLLERKTRAYVTLRSPSAKAIDIKKIRCFTGYQAFVSTKGLHRCAKQLQQITALSLLLLVS